MDVQDVHRILHSQGLPSTEITPQGWHYSKYYHALRIGGSERLKAVLAAEELEKARAESKS